MDAQARGDFTKTRARVDRRAAEIELVRVVERVHPFRVDVEEERRDPQSEPGSQVVCHRSDPPQALLELLPVALALFLVPLAAEGPGVASQSVESAILAASIAAPYGDPEIVLKHAHEYRVVQVLVAPPRNAPEVLALNEAVRLGAEEVWLLARRNVVEVELIENETDADALLGGQTTDGLARIGEPVAVAGQGDDSRVRPGQLEAPWSLTQ